MKRLSGKNILFWVAMNAMFMQLSFAAPKVVKKNKKVAATVETTVKAHRDSIKAKPRIGTITKVELKKTPVLQQIIENRHPEVQPVVQPQAHTFNYGDSLVICANLLFLYDAIQKGNAWAVGVNGVSLLRLLSGRCRLLKSLQKPLICAQMLLPMFATRAFNNAILEQQQQCSANIANNESTILTLTNANNAFNATVTAQAAQIAAQATQSATQAAQIQELQGHVQEHLAAQNARSGGSLLNLFPSPFALDPLFEPLKFWKK
jgi:hypothetical protein